MQAQNDDDSGRADAFADGRGSSWAHLIKKVYEAAPLVCARCSGKLDIVSLLGDNAVIEKIPRHLKLWDRPKRPPPPAPDRSNHYDPDIAGWEQADPQPVLSSSRQRLFLHRLHQFGRDARAESPAGPHNGRTLPSGGI